MSTQTLARTPEEFSPKLIVLVMYVNMVSGSLTMYSTFLHLMGRIGLAAPLTCFALCAVVLAWDVYLVF